MRGTIALPQQHHHGPNDSIAAATMAESLSVSRRPLVHLICSTAYGQACRMGTLKRDHHDLRQLQDELPGPTVHVCFKSALCMPPFGILALFWGLQIALWGHRRC